MSILNNVSFEDIYNKVMLILIANESTLYDQYKLYSLVIDKFNVNKQDFIPPEFKCKFLITIRQLMSKDENVKVIKTNGVYQVIYNAPSDINLKNVYYSSDWIDESNLNSFIIDNKIELNYQDPESGNTISHNLLKTTDFENIKKLLEMSDLKLDIKNNDNKTPIECINNIHVASIIIDNLYKKIEKLEEKVEELVVVSKKIYNLSFYDLIKLKVLLCIDRNWHVFVIILALIIVYLIIKL